MEISIIIPAYNEERNIEKTVKSYYNILKKNKISFEIIISADGCTDKTPEIAENLSKKYKEIKTNISKEKRGKGGGVFSAFKKAEGEFIGITDADESVSAEEFYNAFKNREDADVILPSRWLPLSENIGSSLLRKVLGRSFNYIIRTLFFMPYRDTQCGSKIIKKEFITPILNDLKITGWAWDINLLYLLKKQGSKVMEYPITWINAERESKFNYKKAIIEMAFSLLRLRLIYSPLSKLDGAFIKEIEGELYKRFNK